MKSLQRMRVRDSSVGAPKDVMAGLIAERATCMGSQVSVRMASDLQRNKCGTRRDITTLMFSEENRVGMAETPSSRLTLEDTISALQEINASKQRYSPSLGEVPLWIPHVDKDIKRRTARTFKA